jgi:hypothetical protein
MIRKIMEDVETFVEDSAIVCMSRVDVEDHACSGNLRVCLDRELCDYGERGRTTTFESPEEVGILDSVGRHVLACSSNRLEG